MKDWVSFMAGSPVHSNLLCQHWNPVAFFQRLEQQGVWRVFWPTRLIVILLGMLILPGSLGALRGEPWVAASTAMAVAVLLFVTGFLMILSGPIGGLRPGLWLAYLFLYHFSFPMLAVVVLCALAALTPVRLWLGWYIGIPVVLGVSLTDVCSLAVYQSACEQRNQRARLRPGGPPADLPELTRQQLAWLLRAFVAGLLVIGALVRGWLVGQEGIFLSIMMLCSAAGCARLESVLLAAFGRPLVYYDNEQKRWHATYVGRTALWVGRTAILRTITSHANGHESSAVLLALFQESGLGLVIQRACAYLPSSSLHPLLLHLSLREGGAEALRFLGARLPPSTQQLAQRYADLATEAAKPLDLQRWIARLPTASAVDGAEIDPDLFQLLVLVRTALVQYQDQPMILHTILAVRQFVQSLSVSAPPARDGAAQHCPLSWPVALSLCLEQHQQRLSTSTRA